ncbi:hypothetical protein, partial [Hymenobacter agri]
YLKTAGAGLQGAFAALLTPTGAIVVALAALAAVVYAVATADERAYASFQQQAAATRQLTTDISPLLDRYDELKQKTTLSVAEQDEMKSIIEKVTAVLPDAGKGFDAYGRAIELNTGKARAFIAQNQELDRAIATKSLPAQLDKLRELQGRYDQLVKTGERITKTGLYGSVSLDSLNPAYATELLSKFRENLASTTTALEAQKKRVAELRSTINGLGAAYEEVTGLQGGDIAGSKALEEGLLASLRERLKLVKEQRENETEVAAIMADNKVIKSLEAQIAALEGVDKQSKKVQDALQKLREELRGNEQLSNALGADYQFLQERQKILEAGLKSLVLAGVSPASKAFRSYVAELKELNTVLGDNELLQRKQIDGLMKLAKPGELDSFGNKIKKNPLTGQALEENKLPKELKAPPVNMQETVNSLTEFQQFVGKFTVGLQQTVEEMSSNFAGAFAGIAQGVGAALADGQSAMQAFGDGLLKAFGQIIVQFGEKLVLLGIGNIAAQNYAVGAAQLAAGGLLIGSGAYVSSQAGGPAGGYSGNSTRSPIGNTSTSASAAPPQKIQVEVVGTLRGVGKDLVAVIEASQYRRLRTA